MAHAAIGKAVGRGRERDLREIWRTEGGRQWARALTTHTSDERPLRSTVLMPHAARWDSIGPLDDAGNKLSPLCDDSFSYTYIPSQCTAL